MVRAQSKSRKKPQARIHSFHLSFVFTETLLGAQTSRDFKTRRPALADFVTEAGYIDVVNAIREGSPVPLGLELPWPHPNGQNFWDRYLPERALTDARGNQCFAKLVPMRLPRLLERFGFVGAEDVTIIADGYFYPHGTGLVFKVLVNGNFTCEEAGSLALRLRRAKVYGIKGSATVEADLLNLEQLASMGLSLLRSLGFDDLVTGVRSDPFSIATIVRGEGVDPNAPFAADSEVHRLLNGLTRWTPEWARLPAPQLQLGKTQIQSSSANNFASHLVLASSRGTAVWFPNQFLPQAHTIHTLGCYHRNLTTASLQAESLLWLAQDVESAFDSPPVPLSVQRLGELSGVNLARLYGGTNTYASGSVRSQIVRSRQLAALNSMRKKLLPGGKPIE